MQAPLATKTLQLSAREPHPGTRRACPGSREARPGGREARPGSREANLNPNGVRLAPNDAYLLTKIRRLATKSSRMVSGKACMAHGMTRSPPGAIRMVTGNGTPVDGRWKGGRIRIRTAPAARFSCLPGSPANDPSPMSSRGMRFSCRHGAGESRDPPDLPAESSSV